MNFDPHSLNQMIDTHGQSLTYVSQSTGPTYDPETGAYGGGTTASYTVKGFFHNYSIENIDGTNVQLDDRKLLLKTVDTSGSSIPEPKNGDTFDGLGDKSVVVMTSKILSGTQVMCYICQVRN